RRRPRMAAGSYPQPRRMPVKELSPGLDRLGNSLAAPLSRVDSVEEGAFGAQVRIRGLVHAYGKVGELPVLRGVDLDVEPGGYVAVTGVSGAGKSTLLALTGGLEPIQGGSVIVAGRDL